MFLNKVAWKSIALTTRFAASMFAQGTTTTTRTRTFTFPPVDLAATETARINLTNLATATTGGTAASCTGDVSFVSSTGAAIGAATNFTVGVGQIQSVSLPFAKAATSGTRAEIRGSVQLTTPTTSAPPCAPEFSMETFDTVSGVTHPFLSNSAIGSAVSFGR